jgi:hypothetical protein
MLRLCIAMSALAAVIQVALYRPALTSPGGATSAVEAAAAFALYAVVIVWATSSRGVITNALNSVAFPLALLAAALQTVHLMLERFAHIPGSLDGPVTLTFMLATFLLWGLAGYRGAYATHSVGAGVVAGCWSAVVTMTLVVAAGFFLEFFLAPPNPAEVATWAEFLRSGSRDPRAFAISNTLDSAVSHLVLGPIIGAIFSLVAGALAMRKPQSHP